MSKAKRFICIIVLITSVIFNIFLGVGIHNASKVSSERLIDNFEYLNKMYKGQRENWKYRDNVLLDISTSIKNIELYMEDIYGSGYLKKDNNIGNVMYKISARAYNNENLDKLDLLIGELDIINEYLDKNKESFIESPRSLEKEIKKKGLFLNTHFKNIEAIGIDF